MPAGRMKNRIEYVLHVAERGADRFSAPRQFSVG
jgi:hypothetical protein